ncbi:MAG: type I-D CRISPR-associated protein Cas7/Csc2 [Chloroflexota bacterium]|nr:type I-D CRISPR-associated protein Cas7/Csc2 [Chloroflexota bacterium]
MTKQTAFDLLQPYLEPHPHPLIGAKTVQLLLVREIHDYTVLRTEDTRELNTVATPLSIQQESDIRRVAFLASKQKAAESRQLEYLLRTAAQATGYKIETTCFLKDNLCLECPRCGLFGATNVKAGRGQAPNIKHRIEYSTAFSLLPFEDIETATTFNAINDAKQITGQALGTRYAVAPATIFPSIVTLRSATQRELTLAIKTILACKSYGAESRIGGDVRNTIFGIVGGWEEVLTPLEFTLELFDRKDDLSAATVQAIAQAYVPLAGNPKRIKVFTPEQVQAMVQAATGTELDKMFLEASYADVKAYRKEQERKK